jgi:hypothetical protein
MLQMGYAISTGMAEILQPFMRCDFRRLTGPSTIGFSSITALKFKPLEQLEDDSISLCMTIPDLTIRTVIPQTSRINKATC